MKNAFFLFFLFSFCSVSMHAQKQKMYIDSLQTTMYGNLSYQEKIDNLFTLFNSSQNYGYSNNKLNEYANELLPYAIKEKNPKYAVYIYTILMSTDKNTEKANMAMDSSIWYASKCDNNIIKAYVYNSVGDKKGIKADAVDYLHKSINLLEHRKDEISLEVISKSYNSLSNYYKIKKDFENSLIYINLAIDKAEESGNLEIICKAWSDLGSIYVSYYSSISKSDNILRELTKEKSIQAFNKAIDIYNKNPKEIGIYQYSQIINNQAIIDINEGNWDHAIKLLDEAIEINIKNAYDNLLVYNYMNIGKCYNEKKYYKKAERFYKKSYDLLTNMDSKKDTYLTDSQYKINQDFAELYLNMGQYEKSAKHYKTAYNLYNDNTTEIINETRRELENKHNTEIKEQEVANLLEKEKSKKLQNYLYIAIAGVLSLGLISIYLFFNFRIKNLQNDNELYQINNIKEDNNSLNDKKSSVEEKVITNISEEQYHTKQDEILNKTQGQGSLFDYKSNFDYPDIERIANTEIIFDNNFKDIRPNVKEIHPDFYKRLQEKANNKLTSLDLKYCTCIYMRLSSKEMAKILKVEANSVRVNKYRLKQKFGLKKSDDLNYFIENLA